MKKYWVDSVRIFLYLFIFQNQSEWVALSLSQLGQAAQTGHCQEVAADHILEANLGHVVDLAQGANPGQEVVVPQVTTAKVVISNL